MQQPQNQRDCPNRDGKQAKPRRNGTFKKGKKTAIRFDHGRDKVLFQHRPQNQPQDRRRDGDVVFFHQKSDNTKDQHQADPKDRIVDGKRPNHAEHQDHRHQHFLRNRQNVARALDRDPTQRQHDQVGQQKHDKHCIDHFRLGDEHHRPRRDPLHQQHADQNGSDRISGDAENKAWKTRKRRQENVGEVIEDRPKQQKFNSRKNRIIRRDLNDLEKLQLLAAWA